MRSWYCLIPNPQTHQWFGNEIELQPGLSYPIGPGKNINIESLDNQDDIIIA